jgi:hypothetical protein
MSPRKEIWVSEINRLIDITNIRLVVLYPVHAAGSFAPKAKAGEGGKGKMKGAEGKRLIFGGATNSDDSRDFGFVNHMF